jgi:hypothetical protein
MKAVSEVLARIDTMEVELDTAPQELTLLQNGNDNARRDPREGFRQLSGQFGDRLSELPDEKFIESDSTKGGNQDAGKGKQEKDKAAGGEVSARFSDAVATELVNTPAADQSAANASQADASQKQAADGNDSSQNAVAEFWRPDRDGDGNGNGNGQNHQGAESDHDNAEATDVPPDLIVDDNSSRRDGSQQLTEASGDGPDQNRRTDYDDAVEKAEVAIREMVALGAGGGALKAQILGADPNALLQSLILVEQEGESKDERAFLIYADDDDELERPWSVRWTDNLLTIEIPLDSEDVMNSMIEMIPEMEAQLAEQTGTKVLVSFVIVKKG